MDWEEEQDPEMEELMNILDEGVDSSLLFKIVGNEDIQMLDFLSQNKIVIDSDILASKNNEGLCPLHLAAKKGLNSFCSYLLNQVSKFLSFLPIEFNIN